MARAVTTGTPARACERGAGTVLLLGVVALVAMLALAVGALGQAKRARGSAQAAADLGALAAATALQAGLDPCSAALMTVRRNDAELAACRPRAGGVVQVSASRATASSAGVFGGVLGPASATARAGPRPSAGAPGDLW